ncbi:MAG: hypothetical protein OER88_09195 [Planctomycetota bacterium]|nr:hypothetical protein [Planctomycetota bacterium]
MWRFVVCVCLLGAALAQESGRDTGKNRPVVFVRWLKTKESGEIYRAAWRALEPFRGLDRRRQIIDLDGFAARPESFWKPHRDASVVVAIGGPAADAARRNLAGAKTVEVSIRGTADVNLLVDRDRLARIVKGCFPDVSRMSVASPRKERLRGIELSREPPGAFAWVAEGVRIDVAPGEPFGVREGWMLPLLTVVTAMTDVGTALHVRPDPRSAGLLAAAAVRLALAGDPPRRRAVRRLRVVIDLDKTRAAGHRVPLEMLARADTIRSKR